MPACRDQCESQFVIEPNCSMSWRGNQVFFLSLLCLSFAIAGMFAWLGLWLILPFAGIEMLILGTALYFCRRSLMRQEVITIKHDKITVSTYAKKRTISCTVPRSWAQVVLRPAGFRGHSRRLYISSHGRQLEIGKMLRDEEKKSLAKILNRTIQIQFSSPAICI